MPRVTRVLQFTRPRKICVEFDDFTEIVAVDHAGVRMDIEDGGPLDQTTPMPPPAQIWFNDRRRRTRSYRSWDGALRALDKLAPGWREAIDAIEDERRRQRNFTDPAAARTLPLPTKANAP